MGMRKGKVFVGSLAMNQRSIDGKDKQVRQHPSLGTNSTLQSQSCSSCQYGFNLMFQVHMKALIYGSEFLAKTSRYADSRGASIRHSFRLHRTTDYATVVLPLPGISNDLEVVRLL